MRFKKVFLLPIVLLGLTSCGGSNPDPGPQPEPEPPVVEDHTLKFVGKNCTMETIDGEKIDTIKVKDGDSVIYYVSVSDTSKYVLPNDVDIAGTVKSHTFNDGVLEINEIKSDVVVTATAKGINEYTITYGDPTKTPGFKWTSPKPSTVKKGTDLVVGLEATDDYILTAENINVFVVSISGKLVPGQYTYSNNIFTLNSDYVVGDITIWPQPVSPTPPPIPTEKYTTEVIYKNDSIESPKFKFPHEPQPLGTPLEGAFLVKKGYRAPTRSEIIDSGAIHKSADGIEHDFNKSDYFYYETGVVESETYPDYIEYGYFYILDQYQLTYGNNIKITITAEPIPTVDVIFNPGVGYWDDETEGNKIATIDQGMQLDVATIKCKAYASILDPSKTFEGWFDQKTGKEIYSTQPINENTSVIAHYRDRTYIIYTENIIGAKVSNFPTEVKYQEAVGATDPKPTITVKEDTSQLPTKSGVNVTMKTTSSSRRLQESEFTYQLSGDKKSATFGINAGVIVGDISISLTAFETITVTVDPNGGTWPTIGGTDVKTWIGKPNTLTYNEILSYFNVGGDPEKKGYVFDIWCHEDGSEVAMDSAPSHSIKITAKYVEIQKADFTNDSWENIIKYANLGKAALDARYGETIQIGAERTLFYKNPEEQRTFEYTVRLIGRDHDVLSSDTTKKAALTFEFENLIYSGMYGHDPAPYSSTTPNNTWETSDYRILMGEAYTTLKQCNPGFDVKTVNKKTMQGKNGGKDPNVIVTTQETLFPLSGSEMGIPKVNKDTNNPVKYNYSTGFEGSLYAYYALGGYYVKTYLGAEATDYSPYWLRSPHTEKEPEPTQLENDDNFDRSMAYYIKGKEAEWSTELGDYGKCTTDLGASYGYAAAFCI